MLSRPPDKSESGLRPGADRPGAGPSAADSGPSDPGTTAVQADGRRRGAGSPRQPSRLTRRPLKASFSRENSPCCPGWNCPVGRSSPRSLASSRSSRSCSGSSLVGV